MSCEKTNFESLAELIGKKGALNLCEQYGGLTLYIRKSLALHDGINKHWSEYFGQEALALISERFGGQRIYIPNAPPELLQLRNATIVACLCNGKTAEEIAADFQLTPRAVRIIFGNRMNTNSDNVSIEKGDGHAD